MGGEGERLRLEIRKGTEGARTVTATVSWLACMTDARVQRRANDTLSAMTKQQLATDV